MPEMMRQKTSIARFLNVHRNHLAEILEFHRVRPLAVRKRPTFSIEEITAKLLRVDISKLDEAALKALWAEPLLKPADAARELEVSPSTVHRLAESEALPCVRIGERIVRFLPRDVRAAKAGRRK